MIWWRFAYSAICGAVSGILATGPLGELTNVSPRSWRYAARCLDKQQDNAQSFDIECIVVVAFVFRHIALAGGVPGPCRHACPVP